MFCWALVQVSHGSCRVISEISVVCRSLWRSVPSAVCCPSVWACVIQLHFGGLRLTSGHFVLACHERRTCASESVPDMAVLLRWNFVPLMCIQKMWVKIYKSYNHKCKVIMLLIKAHLEVIAVLGFRLCNFKLLWAHFSEPAIILISV